MPGRPWRDGLAGTSLFRRINIPGRGRRALQGLVYRFRPDLPPTVLRARLLVAILTKAGSSGAPVSDDLRANGPVDPDGGINRTQRTGEPAAGRVGSFGLCLCFSCLRRADCSVYTDGLGEDVAGAGPFIAAMQVSPTALIVGSSSTARPALKRPGS